MKLVKSILLVCSCVLATACGGGDGGGLLPSLECPDGYVPTIDTTNNFAGCVPISMLIIHGVVTDSQSTETNAIPVQDVTVTVYPDNLTATTDANGYFSISGLHTVEDLLVTFTHANYDDRVVNPVGRDLSSGSPPIVVTPGHVGNIAIDASTTLVRHAGNFRVAGSVYAGPAPAAGAQVTLYDQSRNVDAAVTVTGADGRFEFTAVYDSVFTLYVASYDANADTFFDYRPAIRSLADPAEAPLSRTRVDLSNVVISLDAMARSILYTNLIHINPGTALAPRLTSGLRLAGENDNILFHFGAPVNPAFVSIELVPVELRTPEGYGEPIAVAATWSVGNSVLTIDPAVALTADANAASQFELRFKSFVWNDGQVAVPATATALANMVRFRFDVSSLPILLPNPTPRFYYANFVSSTQVATQVKCDAQVCWVLDGQDYYFGGFVAPVTSGGSGATCYFNGEGTSFQLAWDHVPGAADYRVYVRRLDDSAAGSQYTRWYRTSASLGSGFVDPSIAPVVFATAVMSNGADADDYVRWRDLDDRSTTGTGTTKIGPLGAGALVDIAVTSVDSNGFESPIDTTRMLTIRDTTQAAIASATPDYTGDTSGPHANTTDLGFSLIKKNVKVTFTEHVSPANPPSLGVTSGNILSMSAAAAISWDPTTPATPENGSRSITMGPVTLRTRGACTPITCDSPTNTTSVCVADPAVVGSASVFFVDVDAGATPTATLIQGDVIVNSVDAATKRIVLATALTSPLTAGSGQFACYSPATPPGPLPDGVVAIGDPALGDTILTSSGASSLYPGEPILLFDPQSHLIHAASVARVRGTTGSIVIDSATTADLSAATVLMPLPTISEYSWRPATTSFIAEDLPVSSASYDVMISGGCSAVPGDLVMIDVDGVFDTVADRYFGTAYRLEMAPATITLRVTAPPAWLRPVPVTTLIHNVSRVWCLGDSLRLDAATMTDTSGNAGLSTLRDQFSLCTSGDAGCDCSSGTCLLVY